MRILSLLLAGLLLVAPIAASAADTGSARDLVGLWQAKRRFGPEVRGELQLIRTPDGWRAEIAGHSAKAKIDGRRIAFDLGDDLGSFRGCLPRETGEIRGHWVQPRNVGGGMAYMTPVVLAPMGAGLWRGEVRPLDDAFTLYLKVTANPDGTTGVFLRNPERNVGNFIDLRRLERSGAQVQLFGRPGGAPKDVPVVTGSYNAEDEVLSLYIPSRGGSYDFSRANEDSDFYPRPKSASPYNYTPPLPHPDGWPVSTLAAEHISRLAIERFVQMLIDMPMGSVHAQEVHGLLIARHGKLVLEEYFHGEHSDKPHDTRSAAKSLTSVMIGAAIQAGAKLSPATPVYAAMGAETNDPAKRAMTLEHLMTMSSGLFCDDRIPKAPGNEDVMQNQDQQPDWYKYALDLPMASRPGETTVYCSTNPNLAGAVLAKATGEPLEETFDRLVARPMQFGRYALDLQPTGQPYMGGGAQFLPRDFMKLGQLMLDGGVWHGRRIVSRAWAERSTAPLRELRGHHYGYFWWGLDFPWKAKTVRAFYAAGNGGQVVMVVPRLDLVIAIYGGNYGDKALYVPQEVYTPKYILPAVD